MPKDVKGKLKAQTHTIRPAVPSSTSANGFSVQNSLYDPSGPIVLERWNDTDYNELNPITWLNTIHQKLKTPAPPKYAYTQEVLANGFHCTVEFLDQRFRSPELRLKKQEAKEDAAKLALLTLEQQMPIIFKQIKDALVKAHTIPKKDVRFCRGVKQIGKMIQPSDLIPRSIEWLKKFKETHVNERPCVMLLEFCQYHKLGQPVYHPRQEWDGTFIMDCEVNSRKFSSEHAFWVTKDAKDHVSQIAFDILYNEFIDKEQADISRRIKNHKMRQVLYKYDHKEETKKIPDAAQPTPLANYSLNNYVYPSYDVFTNYYTPENIQAVTNLTFIQPLGYQDPNGNTNNTPSNTLSNPLSNTLSNTIGYNLQQAVDSYGCASSSIAPFFNNVEFRPDETYVFPTQTESQSTSVSYVNVADPSTSQIQASVSNAFHPYAIPAKNETSKKISGRNRKKRLCVTAILHKPKRAPEKVVSDKNGRLLRKKYVTLLHELCQKRNWGRPDFDFHIIYGGYRCTVTINCRIFTGSKLCPKKVDAKEEVAELAYKFYENDE